MLRDYYDFMEDEQQQKYAPIIPYFQRWTKDEMDVLKYDEASALLIFDETLTETRMACLQAMLKAFLAHECKQNNLEWRVKSIGETTMNYQTLFRDGEKYSLSKLFRDMISNIAKRKHYYANVEKINFSSNALVEKDMPMVFNILNNVRDAMCAVPCVTLDICSNSFGKTTFLADIASFYTAFMKILRLPYVKLVICYDIAWPRTTLHQCSSFFGAVHANHLLWKLEFMQPRDRKCPVALAQFMKKNEIEMFQEEESWARSDYRFDAPLVQKSFMDECRNK